MFRKSILPFLLVGSAAMLLTATAVQASIDWDNAESYSFRPLTAKSVAPDPDNAAALAAGANQLKLLVGVDTEHPDQVTFRFLNVGTAQSSITDVYFDDGQLKTLDLIQDSGDGVWFKKDANPGNVPDHNGIAPSFDASKDFTADSASPVSKNGVNNFSGDVVSLNTYAGDWVEIVFQMEEDSTVADVIQALATRPDPDDPDNISLRVAVHVQAFENGVSASFVANTPSALSVVPEPTCLAVWSTFGVMGLCLSRFRGRRN
jgi:hypothetical protein